MSTTHVFDVRHALTPGVLFATRVEVGCRVITVPDDLGNFDAFDSDDVVCSFSLQMVEIVYLEDEVFWERRR